MVYLVRVTSETGGKRATLGWFVWFADRTNEKNQTNQINQIDVGELTEFISTEVRS
jgi:hypothetical protein